MEVFCSAVADNVYPAIPEARLPGDGMVLQIDKIFWELNKPPDRNPENSADQRRLFIVRQRCISLSNVVASAETAHRRPRVRKLERRTGACAV